MICDEFKHIGEYAAAGAFEEPERSLFYRKALGIRRYYENCTLYEYDKNLLYPSGTKKKDMAIFPDYLNGLAIDGSKISEKNEELVQAFKTDFCKYSTKVPYEHAVAGNMWCHSIPNYERIAKEGLDSYKDRIKRIKDNDLREGLMHVYEGIRCYVKRCISYLEEVEAEEKLVNALKKVPLGKAENIYEAIVSRNFIMYLDNCDNLGCIAKDLYEFYNGEDITSLLENLFDNLDKNNGYSIALNTDYNEITTQVLKAAAGKRRPMIELFVNESTPVKIWEAAFELIKTHGGQPAFYNPDVLLNGLQKRFDIPDNDLKCFCGGGCTESMFEGLSNVGSVDAGINLLLILEQVIYKYLNSVKSFGEFYNIYIAEVKKIANMVMEKISLSQKERAVFNPLPMRTLLIDDCIDKGVEYNNGGARYKWSIVNFAGLINVIDSMFVIRDFVFDKKTVTAEEFCEKLKNNDEHFLQKCRLNKNVYGIDNDDVNSFTDKLTKDIYSMLDNNVPYLGGGYLPASIQFMSQVEAGRKIGATPDGRKSGAPLCDSLGAIFGKDKKGPTSLLKSVASINQERALGTPVLNFNIDETWNDEVLKALILSYMQMGGIQMQITCISESLLKEAYEHPEDHGNLVVRVGGYSEYFCNLSEELKKMIMDRTIQKCRL